MSLFDDDRDLLDRFRRGERDALAAVYERYVDQVATLARRGFTIEAQGHLHVPGCRDVDDEHEVVHDTFVRAFSEPARLAYDGLRPYRPYLLRIAKNLMIDRHRARRRQGARMDRSSLGDIDALLERNADLAAMPAPEEDLHWKSLSAATSAVLADLDAESRELVRLRFEEELSQDQVAARLGCSRRRVRTIEARVQKAVRARLRRLGL